MTDIEKDLREIRESLAGHDRRLVTLEIGAEERQATVLQALANMKESVTLQMTHLRERLEESQKAQKWAFGTAFTAVLSIAGELLLRTLH